MIHLNEGQVQIVPGMAKESVAGEGRRSGAALAKRAKMVGLPAAEDRGPKEPWRAGQVVLRAEGA